MSELQNYLLERKELIPADVVGKKSGYDKELSNAIGFIDNKSRYYDATWNDSFYEYKKVTLRILWRK